MDFRDASRMSDADESILAEPYRPFYKIFGGQPILVKQCVQPSLRDPRPSPNVRFRNNDYDRVAFRERPWMGVLLFDNVSSDARDHAANERSMLGVDKIMKK